MCTKLPWRDKNGNIIGIIGANRDITERKIAEQALQESETRYKAIFESAREGIIVGIIETKQFMYANPAICKMFGYTAEELTRLTVKDIHPKERLPYVSDRFEALMRSEVAFTQNIPCLRKNGTVFYADISATRIVINNKDCFVGFFTDTTERKHAEESLREKSALLVKVINSVPDFIFAKDTKLRSIICNEAYASAVGKKPEEMIGHTDIENGWDPELVCGNPAKGIRGFENDDRDALSGKTIHNPCDPANTPNGVLIFDTYKMPLRGKDGEIIGMLGIARDITERKHAEEALRESEEKYRGLADRSFDMIFMTDARGFIKYLSPASERIFGYKPQEMVGKHFANFLLESEIPKATKRFTEKLQGKKLDVLYLEAKKKDGSRVFIELNSSLVIQDGKISGTQGIIKDVTERRKAEEQLRKAHEELEIRVKQRTADLAGVVEDLQNEIAERKLAEESLRNAEERFRTIFENTIVGLYRTTPDGRILLANPALIKMMGCRPLKNWPNLTSKKAAMTPQRLVPYSKITYKKRRQSHRS